jgi:hypothetical protein
LVDGNLHALLLTPAIPGDVNFDGIVNGQGRAQIASHWLQSGFPVPGDANGDGIVNGQDIALVAPGWLQCSGGGRSAVPEPASFALAAFGGGALLTRARCKLAVRRALKLSRMAPVDSFSTERAGPEWEARATDHRSIYRRASQCSTRLLALPKESLSPLSDS